MIVIASRNEHKVDEIRALPCANGLDLKAIGSFDGCPDVEEDGTSFEENAAIKAVRYSLWLKREHKLAYPVIAEDSGLCVEALLGWPGINSARAAETNEARISLVLEKLKGNDNRGATFTASTALAASGMLSKTWVAGTSGRITAEPRGNKGFGYDPVFEIAESGRTFAEMSQWEKSSYSHRAKAWAKALAYASLRYSDY